MSKTDNTRPYELQAHDPTMRWRVSHFCYGVECDYSPRNGVNDLRASHIAGRSGPGELVKLSDCVRKVDFYGGVKQDKNGSRRFKKRLDRRKRRQTVAQALRRMTDPEDFDVLQIRGGRRTRHWF